MEPRSIVAVVPDLFFQAKIREAARVTGSALRFASSEEALRRALSAGDVGLVIISLEAREPDPFLSLTIARAGDAPRIVGFLNHVEEDLKERALAAGCDEVLAKGAFSKSLPEILRRGAAPKESS